MKEAIREIYPQAKSQNEAVDMLCKETGYTRASVMDWLSGTREPRPVVLQWFEYRKHLERLCALAEALEEFVEQSENDRLKPDQPRVSRHEVRDLVAEIRASCSPLG